MATDNSTTTVTPPISNSDSLAASTNTTSTGFSTSTTSSPTARSSTDARGRPSDAWTTSTIILVTVSHSTPTTSTLTTVVQISGPSLSGSSSFRRPLSSVGRLTQSTTETVTEGVPKSGGTTSAISDASKSHHQPSVPVLVIIGLVVASFISGILFLLFYCRRRRRHRQKEVEHLFQRPESCSSFLDTDPFVCVTQIRVPSMRSAEDEDQRGTTRASLDATMTSNWWDSVGRPRSLENDSTTLPSQHGTRRSSPCLPTSYSSTLFEQDEIVGGEGQFLKRYPPQQNPNGPPTFIPISSHLPPSRPPRSPRRQSKRSARHSFDSVSTAHSSSAPLLHRPPANRLEGLP